MRHFNATDPAAMLTASAALLFSLTLVTGCGAVSSASSRSDVNPPAHSATQGTEQSTTIQHDKKPVLKMFPQLGNVTEVAWDEVPLGSTSSRALPGPTDYHFSGVAHLAKEDVQRLQQGYVWTPAEEPPSVLGNVAPLIPKGVAWKISEEFTATGDVYSATFHFDPVSGVVIFDGTIS